MFLMKRIGYQFEYGKNLSVKVPGGKWYHELDKLDERFSEEKFRFYLDMPFTSPRFVVGNTVAIHKRGISDFRMKYYRRIYQARMVEQHRFDKHSAYLARELERMNQLQEQYLFLVNNDIKSIEGLVTYQVLKERDMENISERQQELYQQNRAVKRACKTEEDIRDYQIWHMGVQAELDELKAEKKAINKKLKIAEGCVEEYKKFSMLDFSTIEDEIRNSIDVPEYPYAEKKDIALSVNDAVSDIDMDGISVMDESEDYDTSLGVEVCEQISAEDTMDATVGDASEANIMEEYADDAIEDLEDVEPVYSLDEDKGTHLENIEEISALGMKLRNSETLRNHIITKTTETAMERFKALQQGQNFHALNDSLKSNTYTDVSRTQNTIYLRLNYDEPSGTVVNVRKSMWVHPTKDRAISVREAARLQTFPDSFVFCGTKDKQYQQVGNAVPPIMAKAIAKKIANVLNKKS